MEQIYAMVYIKPVRESIEGLFDCGILEIESVAAQHVAPTNNKF